MWCTVPNNKCSYTVTRERMYLQRNSEARSRNHSCHSECAWGRVYPYPACNAHAPYCIALCSFPGSTIFFDTISYMARFAGKPYWTQNVCSDFLYTFCLKCFSFWEAFSDFDKTWIFPTIFRKHSNIKFYENLFSESRVVPCRQADGRTDGRTWRS